MSRAVKPPRDFETALAELEAIVARMESGQLALEDSLSAYQRGAELLAYCRDTLDRSAQQVSVLENGVLKPFLDSTPGESG
jgi:exodeoxyribonuclease VII small subunit